MVPVYSRPHCAGSGPAPPTRTLKFVAALRSPSQFAPQNRVKSPGFSCPTWNTGFLVPFRSSAWPMLFEKVADARTCTCEKRHVQPVRCCGHCSLRTRARGTQTAQMQLKKCFEKWMGKECGSLWLHSSATYLHTCFSDWDHLSQRCRRYATLTKRRGTYPASCGIISAFHEMSWRLRFAWRDHQVEL